MNTFLQAHEKRILAVKHKIEEERLKSIPENNNLPVADVVFLLNGMHNEIIKLQSEVDNLKIHIKNTMVNK
jgi:hypothetical protein